MEANVVESYHKSFVMLHFMIEKGQEEEEKKSQHLSQKINQQTDTDGLSISYLTMNTYRKKGEKENQKPRTATHHPPKTNWKILPGNFILSNYFFSPYAFYWTETYWCYPLNNFQRNSRMWCHSLTPHTEIHIFFSTLWCLKMKLSSIILIIWAKNKHFLYILW